MVIVEKTSFENIRTRDPGAGGVGATKRNRGWESFTFEKKKKKKKGGGGIPSQIWPLQFVGYHIDKNDTQYSCIFS